MTDSGLNSNVPKEPGPFKKALRKFGMITAIVIILGLLFYYFICGLTYSEGTRSGILVKVSKKGYVFKTYEGELNIGGLDQGDGTIMPATQFKFSIDDKAVYQQLEAKQGKKVVVHYKEVIHAFFWQGESNYFIHAVNDVK